MTRSGKLLAGAAILCAVAAPHHLLREAVVRAGFPGPDALPLWVLLLLSAGFLSGRILRRRGHSGPDGTREPGA